MRHQGDHDNGTATDVQGYQGRHVRRSLDDVEPRTDQTVDDVEYAH